MDTVMERALLEAFVDGALAPEEAARVVMHLADCPADQAFVDALMELNAVLAEAYGAPMAEPVPGPILSAVHPVASEPRVLAFRQKVARAAPYLGGAIAAVLALALILPTLSVPFGEQAADAPGIAHVAGPLDAESSLQLALETRASGAPLYDAAGAEVVVIATFLDREQRPCREFEVLSPSEHARTRGIACRDPEPRWSVAFAASKPLGDPTAAQDSAQGYIPAAGASDAALSEALDALGAGAGLTPADEGALIASGWRP